MTSLEVDGGEVKMTLGRGQEMPVYRQSVLSAPELSQIFQREPLLPKQRSEVFKSSKTNFNQLFC